MRLQGDLKHELGRLLSFQGDDVRKPIDRPRQPRLLYHLFAPQVLVGISIGADHRTIRLQKLRPESGPPTATYQELTR